jgi:hypothetical protein
VNKPFDELTNELIQILIDHHNKVFEYYEVSDRAVDSQSAHSLCSQNL